MFLVTITYCTLLIGFVNVSTMSMTATEVNDDEESWLAPA